MERFLRRLIEENSILLGFVIAFWGGVVRGMRSRREDFTWWGFVYRVMAAGFVGVLAGLVMGHARYPPTIEAAIIGASGYGAVDLLDYLPRVLKEKIQEKTRKL